MAGFGEEKAGKKKNKINSRHKWSANEEALLKRAIKHHAQGDLIHAEKRYREMIKLGYKHPAVLINLGVICGNKGCEEEAILLYKKAIEANPSNPDAYFNLSSLYRKLGYFDKALVYNLEFLKLKPKHPIAHMNIIIYKELGKLNQARVSILKSIELKPKTL